MQVLGWQLAVMLLSLQAMQAGGARMQAGEARAVTFQQLMKIEGLAPYDSLEPWQKLWLQDVFPDDHPRVALELENVSQLESSGRYFPVYPNYHPVVHYPVPQRPVRWGIPPRHYTPTPKPDTGHPWSAGVSNEKKVGTGSFGDVYVSHFSCVSDDWHCAIKVPKVVARGAELQALTSEFKIQAQMAQATGLSISVLDTRERGGKVYSLLEAADGGDLDGFLRKVWPEGLAKQDDGKLVQVIFSQLNLAMMTMHNEKLVHRDLKPANIMINKKVCSNRAVVDTAAKWVQQGCALKITDYGLSCDMKKGCPNTIAGTPAYMSPRQFLGKTPHPSMDMWAVGVIFYNLLFNQSPYYGHTIEALRAQVVRDASEQSMSEPPDRRWVSWALGNKAFWEEAQDVLSHLLTRDVSQSGRYTAAQVWASKLCEPMRKAAVSADKAEISSPLRTLPTCVAALARA